MNKIYTCIFIVLWSCDTVSNIAPIENTSFVKYYGSIGNQQGVALKATPDGGFIVGGNSQDIFGGVSDFILIKVDAQGNQEWYQSFDSGGDDQLIDVLVESDSYVVAGTSTINATPSMYIFRVDADGNEIAKSDIGNFITEPYSCTGITEASNGNFIVTGINQVPSINSSSAVIILQNDLSRMDHKFFGKTGEVVSLTKGFDVLNHTSISYIIFGISSKGTEFFQLDATLGDINTANAIISSTSQITDVVKVGEQRFYVMSNSENDAELGLVSTPNTSSDFIPPNASHRIRLGSSFNGKYLIVKQNSFAVSGILKETSSSNTKSTLMETSPLGEVAWQRVIGTDFSFDSGQVVALADGAVVYTGTAGLKDQTKVFLIKVNSNGQME